jgi:hypothetical protein
MQAGASNEHRCAGEIDGRMLQVRQRGKDIAPRHYSQEIPVIEDGQAVDLMGSHHQSDLLEWDIERNSQSR